MRPEAPSVRGPEVSFKLITLVEGLDLMRRQQAALVQDMYACTHGMTERCSSYSADRAFLKLNREVDYQPKQVRYRSDGALIVLWPLDLRY